MLVGRISGLAVALGIGAAMAGGSGVAFADAGRSDSSSSDSPSTKDTSPSVKDSASGTDSPSMKVTSPSVKDSPSTKVETGGAAEQAANSISADAKPDEPTRRSISPSVFRADQVDVEATPTHSTSSTSRSSRPGPITSFARSEAESSSVHDDPQVPIASPSSDRIVTPESAVPGVQSAAIGTPQAMGDGRASPAQRNASITATSPLGTQQQLEAEQQAAETANSLPVVLMKMVLRLGFLSAARQQFAQVGGPDQGNLDQLDAAVDEYATGAAFQQQILDSNNPTIVMQVAPPHTWYGQAALGSRILYDNPDTIYRFMGVNAASTYVIRGQFTGDRPADTTFSVLTGLSGNTAAVLGGRDLAVNPDGSFEITVSRDPAGPGQANHLQLTNDSTLIATRNTLSDWGSEVPMTLSVERIGGPPDSLFSQLGGFAIPGLGPLVVGDPLLTALVSLIPPLADPPPVLRGVFAAVIMALGIQREATYMAVATTDPETGQPIPPNVLKSPTRNAEFLATQLQSAGYFQLTDEQALVVTVDPGNAGYFVLPVTNDWTISNDYWNLQTSLNDSQAIANPDGTYTLVIASWDPGVANWVSTGGLRQGTISMRFQDLDAASLDLPTVSSRVVALDQLATVLPASTVYYTEAQRAAQLAARKAGYDNRFAPYPQP